MKHPSKGVVPSRAFETLVATMAVLAGCAPGGQTLLNQEVPRLPQVAGGWIDLAKTTSTDTSVWVLSPDGRDDVLRIQVRRASSGGVSTHASRRHNARWYLTSAEAASGPAQFCIVRRIGRDGASCAPFALDSVVVAGVVHRRLLLHGYYDSQGRGGRVLLERVH